MTNTYNNTTNLSSTYGAIPTTTGQIFTTNGSSSNWTNPADTVMVIKQDPAALAITGNVTINGFDLEERLKTIERVLAIPERDAKIEAKYPSLKKKFDDYINSLEKYRTFERIKGDD